MNRLFVRIFVAFLLCILLNTVLFVVVSMTLRQEPILMRYLSFRGDGGMVRYYADMLAETYALTGSDGLDRCLEQTEHDSHLHLFAFGPDGTVLSRRQPSPSVVLLAHRVLREGIADRPRIQWPGLRFGILAHTGGKPFVLVTEEPEGMPLHFATPLLRIFLILTVIVVICAVLARHLTDPILELQGAVRRLAEGDLTARPTGAMQRQDEIGNLARDFDRMAGRLTTSLGAQRRLLADVSHELRSPLARLNVAVELARHRGEGGNASLILDRIDRESERMNTLIGELLILSRLESDTAKELLRNPVDLSDLVAAVVADADFEARSRGCQVELDSPEPKQTLPGEPELLRRAVENVVRNALKYTAEGSVVLVSLSHVGDRAEVCVRDHGPGVPEEQLAELFRPFYRVEGDRDRATGGAGLGLSITERAIALHGGTVRAENAPDGGLQITLSIPLTTGSFASGTERMSPLR